mmetsp:Transcript_4110/g.10679  ORF Transcript_4110/g.10679 Transcript_4110/m.10679 type:complete len:247 (-) Transcript_4110:70-810(-)
MTCFDSSGTISCSRSSLLRRWFFPSADPMTVTSKDLFVKELRTASLMPLRVPTPGRGRYSVTYGSLDVPASKANRSMLAYVTDGVVFVVVAAAATVDGMGFGAGAGGGAGAGCCFGGGAGDVADDDDEEASATAASSTFRRASASFRIFRTSDSTCILAVGRLSFPSTKLSISSASIRRSSDLEGCGSSSSTTSSIATIFFFFPSPFARFCCFRSLYFFRLPFLFAPFPAFCLRPLPCCSSTPQCV